jgi:serine/threonine-protein kinase
MSPEQARGEVDLVDERTDVYALGAILHVLLTGRTQGEGAEAQREETVPPVLNAICARAMAAERDDRYRSAREISDEVMRYLAGLRVSAYAEGLWGTTVRLATKYRTALLLVLAYLAMRVLLLFFARV